MITEPIAEALAWKYLKSGGTITTIQNQDGSFSLIDWAHPDGIPRPSEDDILNAVSQYKAYILDAQNQKALKLKDLESSVQAFQSSPFFNMSSSDLEAWVDGNTKDAQGMVSAIKLLARFIRYLVLKGEI